MTDTIIWEIALAIGVVSWGSVLVYVQYRMYAATVRQSTEGIRKVRDAYQDHLNYWMRTSHQIGRVLDQQHAVLKTWANPTSSSFEERMRQTRLAVSAYASLQSEWIADIERYEANKEESTCQEPLNNGKTAR